MGSLSGLCGCQLNLLQGTRRRSQAISHRIHRAPGKKELDGLWLTAAPPGTTAGPGTLWGLKKTFAVGE